MRKAGILLPVFSLPGPHGIGCFSKEAYEFVDFLEESGQTYWQILPLGPTSYGDSPYQSFSTFAGNPYFIDLEGLVERGLLTKKEVEEADIESDTEINYAKLYENRLPLLAKAFHRLTAEDLEEVSVFREENKDWVEDYALFMAIKHHFGDGSFTEWPEDVRLHKEETLEKYRAELADAVSYHIWVQCEFYKEWAALKAYANEKKILIIGDLPIYVSADSSDAWAGPELFCLDEDLRPTEVAGCPPDAFSADGQLWGNPIYDWQYHEKTGFAWWKKRIEMSTKLYDVIRIDHFRGLESYYAIPGGAPNARKGVWKPGPGMKLINALKPVLEKSDAAIIAEDLGFMTEEVKQLVKDSGFPNMKVIQFAFDLDGTDNSNDHLPYNIGKNSVSYTGTHDNETLLGWFLNQPEKVQEFVQEFAGSDSDDPHEICQRLIRVCHSTPSDHCVIPLQDYLGLNNSARINTPSTLGGNWVWRTKQEAFTPELASYIKKLTKVYGRD